MGIIIRGVTLTDEQENVARELEKNVARYPYTAAAMIVYLSGLAGNPPEFRLPRPPIGGPRCADCSSKLIDGICPDCNL